MTEHPDHRAFTRIEGAIRNPANPDHLMVVRPVARRVRVFSGSTLLAETTEAIRVLEAGRTLYDPVLYVPAEDIRVPLATLDRTTHCPLKGEARYLAFAGDEVAWVYEAPFDFARVLTGRRAFWPDRVRVEEGA